MDLSRPLGVVSPTIDADVLLELASSDVAFTGRQLHRVMDRHSQTGVNRVLNRLVHEGIVARTTAGSARTYTLNRDHLQADAIIELARARERLVDRLSETMRHWSDQPHFAALYGSAARGEHSTDSDIDVFVVRPAEIDDDDADWSENLLELRTAVGRWTGNDCEIVEYAPDEVEAGFAQRDPFITSVGQRMIVLIGERSYLRRTAKRRPRKPTDG